MAGYDEPLKIVTGLLLLSSGVIDTQTLQENLAKAEARVKELVEESETREKEFKKQLHLVCGIKNILEAIKKEY